MAKLRAQLERFVATGGTTGDLDRSSRIEVTGTELPPSPRRARLPLSPRLVNDEVERSTKTIAELQERLRAVTTENERLQRTCNDFTDKLKKREAEISRLGKLTVASIEGSNGLESQSMRLSELEKRLESKSLEDASRVQIEQLTMQVDFLTEQVARYEEKLKDASKQTQQNASLGEKLR